MRLIYIDDAQFHKADLRCRGYVIHSLHDTIPDGLEGLLLEVAAGCRTPKRPLS